MQITTTGSQPSWNRYLNAKKKWPSPPFGGEGHNRNWLLIVSDINSNPLRAIMDDFGHFFSRLKHRVRAVPTPVVVQYMYNSCTILVQL